MRQVGVICAAALVALQENLIKLEGDHKNAKVLAEGLNQIKGLRVNVAAVETNIIFFDIVEGSKISGEKLYKHLVERGVFVMLEGPSRSVYSIKFTQDVAFRFIRVRFNLNAQLKP
ncbi:hypothetical protein Goari_015164, partial [Gossypium aridum]|nr:hypothetical protein [Gossypium aridum]